MHTKISGPDTGNFTNSEKLTILSCDSGHQVSINDYEDCNAPHYVESVRLSFFVEGSAWELSRVMECLGERGEARSRSSRGQSACESGDGPRI